jgi:uncharacterized protein YoaH (UPF0181 family)
MAKPLLDIEKELAKERMLRGNPTQKFGEGEAIKLFAEKIDSNPETVRQNFADAISEGKAIGLFARKIGSNFEASIKKVCDTVTNLELSSHEVVHKYLYEHYEKAF